MPSRIEGIQAKWAEACERSWSADSLRELLRLTHTLAGSAGTFGYARLGKQALHLEWTLNRMLADGQAPVPADLDATGAALAALDTLAAAGADETESDLPATAAGHAGSSGMTADIVLLEDDPLVAAELSEQLGYRGFRVQHCARLDEMDAVLARVSPAALIVDVGLPDGSLDDPVAAQRLHDIQPPGAPVVFISVRDDWPARLAATRAGASAYLVKPIDYDVLAAHLSEQIAPLQRDPYRVLIVEDEIELGEHFAEVLRGAGMLVEVLPHPEGILDVLARLLPDLILMDLYMPGCTGIEVTGVVRQIEAYQGIPIVFLSTEPLKEKRHAALRLGGDDFLRKPILNDDLVDAVAHRAERFRFLNALMVRDSLTGLLNHATLRIQLDTLLAQAVRSRSALSFAMIDIDHFKAINDRYGHPKGDMVIRSLTRMLKQRLRAGDAVGRYGGEEFAVIMPDTPLEGASKIIGRLRQAFGEITHHHEQGSFRVTLSGGVAATPPCASGQEVIDRADLALYRAKHAGRNRVETDD